MNELILVEDHEDLRQLWKLALSPKFNVHLASSGQEALQVFSAQPNVKAIITDLHLPDMSGLELIKTLRLKKADLPILMITGDRGAEFAEAQILPHTKCLFKPVSIKDLLSALDAVIG